MQGGAWSKGVMRNEFGGQFGSANVPHSHQACAGPLVIQAWPGLPNSASAPHKMKTIRALRGTHNRATAIFADDVAAPERFAAENFQAIAWARLTRLLVKTGEVLL